MLLSVLLQAACGKVWELVNWVQPLVLVWSVIGAGVGIGKIGGSANGGHCPPAGSIRRYPYEHDYCRCLD